MHDSGDVIVIHPYHPGLEVNKWGVMKVADGMKELEVNAPWFKTVKKVVGCCLWWVDSG